jgi:hypothetical protein
MKALSSKYGQNGWSLLSSFYIEQLTLCDDDRSAGTIPHLLDLAYHFVHHEGQTDPNATELYIDDDIA